MLITHRQSVPEIYLYTLILKFCLLQSISQPEEPYQSLLHMSCSTFTLLLSAPFSSKAFPHVFSLSTCFTYAIFSTEHKLYCPSLLTIIRSSDNYTTSNKSFIMPQFKLHFFSRHSHNTHNCIVYYNCLFICFYFSLGYKFYRSETISV